MCCLPCREKVTRPSPGHPGVLRMASASSVLQAPSTHALVLCGAQLQLWGPAVVLVAVVSPSGMQTGQIPQERVQNPFRCHLFWAAQPLACVRAMSVFSPCLWSGRCVPVFLTVGLFGLKKTILCTFLVRCTLGDTPSGNSNSKAKR